MWNVGFTMTKETDFDNVCTVTLIFNIYGLR